MRSILLYSLAGLKRRLANYSTRSHPNGRPAFALPVSWEVEWDDAGFQAHSTVVPGTYLIGKWEQGNEPDMQRLFHEHLDEATIIFSGAEHMETWADISGVNEPT